MWAQLEIWNASWCLHDNVRTFGLTDHICKVTTSEETTKHAGTSAFVSNHLSFSMLMWKLKDQHVCVFAKSLVPHFDFVAKWNYLWGEKTDMKIHCGTYWNPCRTDCRSAALSCCSRFPKFREVKRQNFDQKVQKCTFFNGLSVLYYYFFLTNTVETDSNIMIIIIITLCFQNVNNWVTSSQSVCVCVCLCVRWGGSSYFTTVITFTYKRQQARCSLFSDITQNGCLSIIGTFDCIDSEEKVRAFCFQKNHISSVYIWHCCVVNLTLKIKTVQLSEREARELFLHGEVYISHYNNCNVLEVNDLMNAKAMISIVISQFLRRTQWWLWNSAAHQWQTWTSKTAKLATSNFSRMAARSGIQVIKSNFYFFSWILFANYLIVHPGSTATILSLHWIPQDKCGTDCALF